MFPGEVLGGMYWAPANKLYVRTPHTTTYSYVHASNSGSEVYRYTYLQTSVECYVQPILVRNYSRVIEPHQTIQSTQPYIKRKVGGTIS